ncbi:MAG: flagellar protein FlbT [Saliniramus fredricksonii]|uniref:Flagellar protein FlbT n=1 Tax=Saliniramus fredricksonii TaxID=1653334 RepID=A0A0P8BR99_9HYPH|nr:flagellar biosynthesis repressor FlbT [Saliniramus fredricksonii]KPQ12059.1 MAG: flagellar protein FlbT [Saliniramus fredricksonii]SCC81447.1 flagellar protein FlbT [Saliniramus fredricksonii]
MPLRIELKPNERLIIGETTIRNGPKRSSFVVESQSRILRESDIITQSEADTPCKRLYVALEHMYLADDPQAGETAFIEIANQIMQAAPGTRAHILAIYEQLQERKLYKALKQARKLIAYETELLALAAGDRSAPAEPDDIRKARPALS